MFKSSDTGRARLLPRLRHAAHLQYDDGADDRVSIGSLDDPAKVDARAPIGLESRMPYFAALATLPATKTTEEDDPVLTANIARPTISTPTTTRRSGRREGAHAMAEFRMTGGCQCGAVRYALHEPPNDPHICHCRMCQKAFGNFFAALTGVALDKFEMTRGKLAVVPELATRPSAASAAIAARR